MARNPFNVLTPFQMDVLDAFQQEPALKPFYLTGGTALAAVYLGHRLSEDLDFFTELDHAVIRMPRVIEKIAKKMRAKISFGRRFETLFECAMIARNGDRVEMDFALDMPGRLKPVQSWAAWGLQIDNKLDIACNKLSALHERSEPKDFVDIYFIHEKYLPLPTLIKRARKKYPELEEYGLAMAFLKVKDVTLWPRMLLPFDSPTIQSFFVGHAKILAKGF